MCEQVLRADTNEQKQNRLFICVAGISIVSNEDQREADDERDLNVRQMNREENRIAIPDYQERKEKKRKRENKRLFGCYRW